MLFGQELFGDTTGLLRVGLISDVVTIENAASSVPRDLHDYWLSDPCPMQIPDRRPPQDREALAWFSCFPETGEVDFSLSCNSHLHERTTLQLCGGAFNESRKSGRVREGPAT